MAYGFEYEFGGPNGALFEQGMIGLGGVITAILLIIVFAAMAFGIISYVFSSLGMYRIAKRRGIHHAWLAWVPVGNSWLLGSISDQYQYVVKRKNTKRRRVLLILSLVLAAISMVFSVVVLVSNLAFISPNASASGSNTALMIVLLGLYYWMMFGVSIAATVICYIAYYDLFRSCKPNNAVLFLILSVVFNVTLPFFVFACSGSDHGMPARRKPAVTEPEAPIAEIPVVEAEVVDEPFEE